MRKVIAIFLTWLILCGFDFNISIPDQHKGRIVDALCNNYKYPATVQSVDKDGAPITIFNPESPAQFSLRVIKAFIRENVEAYEATKAGDAARQAAIVKTRAEIGPSLDGSSQ